MNMKLLLVSKVTLKLHSIEESLFISQKMDLYIHFEVIPILF